MAYNATNGGSQMVTWESDAAIVPTIPGNAGGGKGGTQFRPCPRETFTILRDR